MRYQRSVSVEVGADAPAVSVLLPHCMKHFRRWINIEVMALLLPCSLSSFWLPFCWLVQASSEKCKDILQE